MTHKRHRLGKLLAQDPTASPVPSTPSQAFCPSVTGWKPDRDGRRLNQSRSKGGHAALRARAMQPGLMLFLNGWQRSVTT